MSAPSGDVYKALMAKVAALVITPDALPVSYPEPVEQFDPPVGGKYLQADLFLNAHAWQGLSAGHLKQGLLQVMVVWPRGQGLVAPKAVAAQIVTHFASGTVMTSGAAKVKVTGDPVEASPLYEPTSVSIPISIPWTA